MNISYSRPLDLGWRRMKQTLFQPFDLGRWFVLGFTAWLAQLGGSSGGGSRGSGYRVEQNLNPTDIGENASEAWHWFTGLAGGVFGIFVVTSIVVGIMLLAVLVVWLSSRGRFMFLDNLVHSRTEVRQPWHEFQAQGNSLFLWRIVYSIVALMSASIVMGGFVLVLVPTFGLPDAVRLLAAVGLGVTVFLFLTTFVYIEYFLDHFVIPIMYKQRLGTTAAWGVFLGLFQAHPGAFVLFGLFYLAVLIGLVVAYLIGGALTCCVGLLLLATPYIGTVLTLPISVLGQFMNLEFLAQFGPDFTLLPPIPDPLCDGSGQFNADGAVIRAKDIGEDAGGDQPGPQGP